MKNLFCILFFIASLPALSQMLSGKILERDAQGKESALPMAGIKWLGSTISTTSDENGNFQIAFPDSFPAKLTVRMMSYKSDTILFIDNSKTFVKIFLKSSSTTLNEVNITGKQDATSNLITVPINTELISKKELTLAACCNLSESFERNASVDVNFTDAVSGTKQIQMLGLDGIYTQILYENLPFVHGLSSSYGLSYIPGPWVEKILVTKGTGSVLNGFESITGQIQIELLEPDKAEKFFVNGYANNESRYELNAHYAHKFNDNLSTILFAHANKNFVEVDRNRDKFLDIPLTSQYNFLNRWHYRIKDKMEGQAGIRALVEDKIAGQISSAKDSSYPEIYSIGIHTKQFETFTKNGLLFPDKPWKSVALMTTERLHQQGATFGNKKYNGEQRSLYVNTIWQDILNNTNHKIKFGGSLITDYYKEKFNGDIKQKNDSLFNSQQIIPGGYSEYAFTNDTNLSVVAGIRTDFFQELGWVTNPRLHIKYNPQEGTAFRLSGGRGIRSAHIFAENIQVLASSREILIQEKLSPEIAWNYGATVTQKFKFIGRDASFNADFFRTDFQTKVVMDLEDVRKVQFYNLKGQAFSNAFQTDFNFSPIERLDVKLAYKYYDVQETYNGKLLDKPLVSKNRALLNIDYATNLDKWKFNTTLKWFGQSRLPNTSTNPSELQLPEHAPAYFTLMAQITKRFRWIEIYLGAENILNYRISNPIITPENPFGTYFDATMIWAPITGRMIYGGFRYKIE